MGVQKYQIYISSAEHDPRTLCLVYKLQSTNIKYPEAMIDDCLKSDNFHM